MGTGYSSFQKPPARQMGLRVAVEYLHKEGQYFWVSLASQSPGELYKNVDFFGSTSKLLNQTRRSEACILNRHY